MRAARTPMHPTYTPPPPAGAAVPPAHRPAPAAPPAAAASAAAPPRPGAARPRWRAPPRPAPPAAIQPSCSLDAASCAAKLLACAARTSCGLAPRFTASSARKDCNAPAAEPSAEPSPSLAGALAAAAAAATAAAATAAAAAGVLPGLSLSCESSATWPLSSAFSSRSRCTSSTTSAKLNSALGASAENSDGMQPCPLPRGPTSRSLVEASTLASAGIGVQPEPRSNVHTTLVPGSRVEAGLVFCAGGVKFPFTPALPGSDSARTFLARLTSAQPVDVVPVLGKPIPITRRPASMSGIGCQEADIKLPDGTRVGNGFWGSYVLRSPWRAAGMAPPQLVPTNTTCQIISVAECARRQSDRRVQPGSAQPSCHQVTTTGNGAIWVTPITGWKPGGGKAGRWKASGCWYPQLAEGTGTGKGAAGDMVGATYALYGSERP
eukprot:scaffold17449_cov52-Phaeocystis_antarctica.AAC.1